MDPNTELNSTPMPEQPTNQYGPQLSPATEPIQPTSQTAVVKPVKHNKILIIALVAILMFIALGLVARWVTLSANRKIVAITRTTSAQSDAYKAKLVAELYDAENEIYPATTQVFYVDLFGSKLKTDIILLPGTETSPLNSNNGGDHITWSCLETCNKTQGGKITYWDFKTNAVSTDVIYVGDANSNSTFVAPMN